MESLASDDRSLYLSWASSNPLYSRGAEHDGIIAGLEMSTLPSLRLIFRFGSMTSSDQELVLDCLFVSELDGKIHHLSVGQNICDWPPCNYNIHRHLLRQGTGNCRTLPRTTTGITTQGNLPCPFHVFFSLFFSFHIRLHIWVFNFVRSVQWELIEMKTSHCLLSGARKRDCWKISPKKFGMTRNWQYR